MRRPRLLIACCLLAVTTNDTRGEELVLDGRLHHIRNTGPREWTEFSEAAEAKALEIVFRSTAATTTRTLFIRQRDVKQAWIVELNGKKLGALRRDENDQVTTLEVGPGRIRDGKNVVRVVCLSAKPDDVVLGDVRLADGAPAEVLNAAHLLVTVLDAGSGKPLPARVTILDAKGALAPIGTKSGKTLAVRPGVVYTASGTARFGVKPGVYSLSAGRGFEYGVQSAVLEARAGRTATRVFEIRREVDTRGLVSCDTHIHTFTHSRHGDASVEERVITIAGEGLELAIATDHDKHIDLEPTAKALGVRQWFTPVVGNEYTTSHGHFNIFPVDPDGAPPDNRLIDWKSIFGAIRTTRAPVVILNHPRDVHRGYRPFGPEHMNAVSGVNLDGERLEANGVELINSAALHSDPMRLVHDWLGLLNHGLDIAPIGSSDSHEVWTKIVGQGRTYIECDDRDPANIDVAAACRAIRDGRVHASLGLLARIEVNAEHGPGDLVPEPADLSVATTVLGPTWVDVDRVILFQNGAKVREEQPVSRPLTERGGGTLFSRKWSLEPPRHDTYLVVVALGPGATWPHFTIAKTYQPASPEWKPYLLSITGVVKIDADGDGKWTSPREYAMRIVKDASGDLARVVDALRPFDQAVAEQAASILASSGLDLAAESARESLRPAAPRVRAGFERFLTAQRECDAARKQQASR